MLLILSPSKTLDFETPHRVAAATTPDFLDDAKKLVGVLKKYSADDIAAFMEISPKLAALNAQRFKSFHTPFTPDNARPALLAFKGDVYEGIEVEKYKTNDFEFAQTHVRILSGLYGLLRPLDLMQPYRLEMGRKLPIGKTKDLYGFWGARLAEALNDAVKTHKNPFVINLASEEYSKAVDRKALNYPVIDIIFKEKQGDKLKIIGLFAKQARGLMANEVVRNRWDMPNCLKNFTLNGYAFDVKSSTTSRFIFTR